MILEIGEIFSNFFNFCQSVEGTPGIASLFSLSRFPEQIFCLADCFLCPGGKCFQLFGKTVGIDTFETLAKGEESLLLFKKVEQIRIIGGCRCDKGRLVRRLFLLSDFINGQEIECCAEIALIEGIDGRFVIFRQNVLGCLTIPPLDLG
ncbi:MAG: hypothetical protein ACD_75C00977G0004 [uncultured bacterium]|nr:MAG: hypothetical protein ACD_75C00977G0004 [uncultured bacterium]